MRFMEIGQQLRAYRLESGLRAEEIAGRLGVSRAALYRYEKGDVIKLETVQRLAEMLNISPQSLLGVGMEYYLRPIAYFERIRQIEETSDQLAVVGGGLCFLTASPAHDTLLAEVLTGQAAAPEAREIAEQTVGILAARKRSYGLRHPGIVHLASLARLRVLHAHGIAAGLDLPPAVRERCRAMAEAELRDMAEIMESEPMGLQFGVLASDEPMSLFELLRGRERSVVAISPFAPDTGLAAGVAMVTGSQEAVSAHQRLSQLHWGQALKGAAAAQAVRRLLAQ